MKNTQLIIKENAWPARLAARRLKSERMAMVFGNTIYLWGVDKKTFLQDEAWLKHELEHVRQYKQHGKLGFVFRYLWESIWRGYRNNRFEQAARAAERA